MYNAVEDEVNSLGRVPFPFGRPHPPPVFPAGTDLFGSGSTSNSVWLATAVNARNGADRSNALLPPPCTVLTPSFSTRERHTVRYANPFSHAKSRKRRRPDRGGNQRDRRETITFREPLKGTKYVCFNACDIYTVRSFGRTMRYERRSV